jgi:hypothetical protein
VAARALSASMRTASLAVLFPSHRSFVDVALHSSILKRGDMCTLLIHEKDGVSRLSFRDNSPTHGTHSTRYESVDEPGSSRRKI